MSGTTRTPNNPTIKGPPARAAERGRLPGRRGLAGAAGATLLAAALVPLAAPAQAETAAVGPVDDATGYPAWYDDGTVRLKFCIDPAEGCLSELPNPAAPISFPDNFPDEAFWFVAEASGGNLGLYEAALEGAFANDAVVAGEQIGFGRLRFRLENLEPGAEYTITHPYGVNTFTATGPEDQTPGEINVTLDEGCAEGTTGCDWNAVGQAFLGDFAAGTTATFLRQTNAPAGTIGDPTVAATVTGAPSGVNEVRVVGPDAGGLGVDTLVVDTFAVQGVVSDAVDGAPGTPNLVAASDTGRSTTDNITRDATPSFSGTMTAADGTNLEILVDGAVAATTTVTGNAFTAALATPLADGTHRVQARAAADATLVSGTLAMIVDTAAPASEVVAPFPSTPTADNTPTLSFASEAGAAFECRLLDSNSAFVPCASPLTYDAQVPGSHVFEVRATDAAGNTGAVAPRGVRIGSTTDTTRPTVVGRYPGAGTTGASVTGNIAVRFSEYVQGVRSTTLRLRGPDGAAVPATVSLNTATHRATLNPSAALAPNTRYTVGLAGSPVAIRDAFGNSLADQTWSFTTGALPGTPTVTKRIPPADSTGALRTHNIRASFSEEVRNIDAGTFRLSWAATGTPVRGTVVRNGSLNQWMLDPANTLPSNSRFRVTLVGGTTGITDNDGNPLAGESWTFTTGTR